MLIKTVISHLSEKQKAYKYEMVWPSPRNHILTGLYLQGRPIMVMHTSNSSTTDTEVDVGFIEEGFRAI